MAYGFLGWPSSVVVLSFASSCELLLLLPLIPLSTFCIHLIAWVFFVARVGSNLYIISIGLLRVVAYEK